MKHLLLVFHSQTGRTQQLANAFCQGAALHADAVELRMQRAIDTKLDDLLWADGIVIASPENFGTLSGMVKDFFDRTYYPAEGKTIGLPWAMLVSAGNDGIGAVRAAQRIANGYGWKAIAEPIIITGIPDASALQRCQAMGEAFAAGLGMGVF